MKKLFSGSVENIIENDVFTTILIKSEDGKFGRTFTGQRYRNYSQWCGARIGDCIIGLEWFNESKGIINADSPIRISPSSSTPDEISHITI